MTEPIKPLTDTQMGLLEEAVASYEASGLQDVNLARYLRDRGLTKQDVVDFRLGIVTVPEIDHERYQGMLSIPYLSPQGKPLSLRFRCLEQHEHQYHGKYNSLPDEPTRMFNIKAIFEATEEIHVTEGELDAVVLNREIGPAVAIPGANNFAWRHQKMLAGFSRIWVWGDPDKAGKEFIKKVTKALPRAKPVRLVAGDVTETLLAEGPQALRDLIREA